MNDQTKSWRVLAPLCVLVGFLVAMVVAEKASFTADECSAKYKKGGHTYNYTFWDYEGTEVLYVFEKSGAWYTAMYSVCGGVSVVEGNVTLEAQDQYFDRTDWLGFWFGFPDDLQSVVDMETDEDLSTLSSFTAPYEGGDSGYPCHETPRSATVTLLCNQLCPEAVGAACQIGTSAGCVCSVDWHESCAISMTVAFDCPAPIEGETTNEEAGKIAGIVILSVILVAILTLILFVPIGKLLVK
ncbi:hypothetical protein Pelo_12994 [Pelomyxa schiedti]|nr:hypothetical protein Pelo_12994 [Pelomyxa schiedti]